MGPESLKLKENAGGTRTCLAATLIVALSLNSLILTLFRSIALVEHVNSLAHDEEHPLQEVSPSINPNPEP